MNEKVRKTNLRTASCDELPDFPLPFGHSARPGAPLQPRSSLMSTVGRVTYPMPLPLTPALQPGATKHPRNLKPFPTVSLPGQPLANQPRCAAESVAIGRQYESPDQTQFQISKKRIKHVSEMAEHKIDTISKNPKTRFIPTNR
ncbi:MAG: hypothetical protein JWM99_2413 [Verrucomicrobiales bacterium]|nr:hypothetical protein [Verrucomicrobiales bacterium]